MHQFLARSLAFLIALTSSSVAFAQTGPVDVQIAKKNFEFSNVFDFQPTGVLHTGDIVSLATVTRLVPETRTRTVTKKVFRIENGRLVSMQVTVEEQYTVMVPVTEMVPIALPAIIGVWYGSNISIWLIHSTGPSGIVLGVGTKSGNSVHGTLIYLGFGSAPLNGIYRISTAVPGADSPSPP